MREFLATYWSLEILIQLAVPIYLLVHHLPRRDNVGVRALVVVVVLLAIAVLPIATGVVTGLGQTESFVVFSGLLGISVLAIVFIFDVGVWPALFCASAGYTIQNLASGTLLLAQILLAHRNSPTSDSMGPLGSVISIAVPLLVYLVCYLVFVRKIDRNNLSMVENRLMLLMFAAVVFMIIGFDIVIKGCVWDQISHLHLILLRLVHVAMCAFILFTEYEILYAQRAQEQKQLTERLLAEREKQFRLSRQNIDAINVKCHDIRHQIRHFADNSTQVNESALADIANEVRVYDSVVETGNEALDTILTEKSLACSNEGITLSCIADGSALDFMAVADIYALFGNALDNAMEAVRRMTDPERRTITLEVTRRANMVAINVENYFTQAIEMGPDGLPLTHKDDKNIHGFGMRSMQAITERYGGTFHVGTDGEIFYLNIVIPQSS